MNQELEQELQTQLDECKKQADEYLNGWKRAKADLINFQKQTEKEKEEWFSFAQANFVLAILPVVDSLESATQEVVIAIRQLAEKQSRVIKNGIATSSSASRDDILAGVKKIYNQMLNVLYQMGVKEIKSIGEQFNPEFHEVVGKEPTEDKVSGLIIKEVQRGYLLNGRVLRVAKVIVSE